MYKDLDPEHEDVLAYSLSDAESGKARYLVVLNFSSKEMQYKISGDIKMGTAKLLRSNWVEEEAETSADGKTIRLRRWEARIYSL